MMVLKRRSQGGWKEGPVAWFLLLLILVALGWILVALHGATVLGCAPSMETEVSPELKTAIGVAVDQSHKEIENDLWAVAVIVLGVMVAGGLTLFLLFWLVTRAYFYLKQKPKWEELQVKEGGEACRAQESGTTQG